MKKVITKVKADWIGSCVVNDEFVTEQELEKQKTEIYHVIVSDLGLYGDGIDSYNIEIEFEVEDIK